MRKKLGMNDDMCLKMEDLRLSEKVSKMSQEDMERKKKGDDGQGERLVNAKRK
jgi:hypothetical protein